MRPEPRTRAGSTGVWDGGNVAASERAIVALARSQHGVVSRTQLLALGMGADAIKRRLRSGRLRMLHRGVYLVGPIAPTHATEMAAVLACGEGAVLSHRSAAQLWRLLSYPAKPAPVDVTIREGDRGRRPAIRVHRVGALERDEVTKTQGIPVTSPARTLLDLAAEAMPRELEQAAAQAETRHLASRRKLLALLARYPRRPGARALRALLEREGRPALTRSEAEERFLAW